MNYQEALDYILSFTDYEKVPGILYTAANYDLRRMEELLEKLANPHLRPRTVHIAGTKGKGSTAAMIASVLIASGYKVGLFTSPHLLDIRERFQVNKIPISQADFAQLLTQIRPEIEALNERAIYGQLTTFEILTALAFAYFVQQKVDFQVLEVGLGGRLDATNVVNPDVCVITSISYDHMEVLGDTLVKIATEKAGIIKLGATVVSSPQVQEAMLVLEMVCRRQKARLIKVGSDVIWQRKETNLHGQSFVVRGKVASYDLTLPLLGDHQLENAAVAVAALEVLAEGGTKITKESIKQGFKEVSWPGRFQILSSNPVLVVDGAHNADSAKKLVETLKQYFEFERCFLVVGTSCDKDIPGIVSELVSLSPIVIVTSSKHPRAADPLVLSAEFEGYGIGSVIAEGVSEALNQALALAGARDVVCVTGSLFIVAEALEWWEGSKR